MNLYAKEKGDNVNKQLNEREVQRIEELSSHGPPPAVESNASVAKTSDIPALSGLASEKFSLTLTLKTEVAHKLHRKALVAASIDIDRYAEARWQVRNEVENGYEAILLLTPAGSSTTIPEVEVLLSSLFTINEMGTTDVHSTYSFVRGDSNLESDLKCDICSKTQAVFETTLK